MASIRCGHCKGTHASVAEVHQCAYEEAQAEAEAEAEYQAERAAERFWEDRGAYEVDEIERALWAVEDERREAAERAWREDR